MKMFGYVAAIMMLAVLTVAPGAYAKRDKGASNNATVPSDVFAKYDKNTNGALDPDEKDAIKADYAKDASNPLLKPFDINNDGKLSDDEISMIPATKTADAPKEKKHKKNK